MNTTQNFKKKLLASAIASYAIFGIQGAMAAEEPADNIEEVLVLGVKGAQQSAIATKREAQSIVDGISAEDIGKLPDTTITDSLQRITGVQIQHSAGEGGGLSIRGMQQVAVMLNGEQFLAAGNLNSAQPDFNDVPAQLLRAADVYKSLDVRNNQSGITGTINIKTFRPFDFKDGFTAAAGYDLSRGEISQQNDGTLNGLLAWRSDNIGVMVSAVTGDKNLANDYAGRASGDPEAKQMGAGSAFNGQWVVTQGHGFEFFSAEDERQRNGLNAALQADLGEGLQLVVEGFYTDAKQYQRKMGLNISNRWQGQGNTSLHQQNLWDPRYSDKNGWSGAQIAAPTHASDTITGKDGRQWIVPDQYDVEALWVYSLTKNRVIDTASKNYNVELKYDNGGAFTGELRAIVAEATNAQLEGTAQGGINSFRGNTVQKLNNNFYPQSYVDRYGLTLDPARLGEVGTLGGRFVLPNPKGYDEDPNLGLTYRNYKTTWTGFNNPIAGNLTDAGGKKSLAAYMANKDSWIMEGEQLEGDSDNSSNLHAFSAKGNYKFDDNIITDVEVGLRNSSRKVNIENYAYWAQFYVGSPNRITSPAFPNANNPVGCYSQWRSIDQKFDGGGSGAECSAGEYIAGHEGDANFFTPYWVLPPQPLDYNGEKLKFVTNLGGNVKGIPGFWAVDPHTFDDPVAFNKKAFGDVKRIIDPGNSYGITLDELSSYVIGNFKTGIVSGNAGVRVVQSELSAETYVSTGVQRTNGGSNYYSGRETRSKSYTYVLPSLNLSVDISDEIKLRFAAAKNKQEQDLDRYGSSLTVFTGPDPLDASQRVPSGWNSNGSIKLKPWVTKNYDISSEYYIGDASMLSLGAYLVKIETFVENKGGLHRDVTFNGKVYDVVGSGPIEGKGGEVKGIELGAKLALSDFTSSELWKSFGVEANYTYSPSERPGFSSDVTGDKYPFANNSKNTYNLAVWYQKDKLQARVALNGRSDRYITDFGANSFAEYEPAATYLDANVSYDVLDNVTVYLQGANLTSTDYKQVYRLANGVEQNAFIYDNEARYSLGVRAKF